MYLLSWHLGDEEQSENGHDEAGRSIFQDSGGRHSQMQPIEADGRVPQIHDGLWFETHCEKSSPLRPVSSQRTPH